MPGQEERAADERGAHDAEGSGKQTVAALPCLSQVDGLHTKAFVEAQSGKGHRFSSKWQVKNLPGMTRVPY